MKRKQIFPFAPTFGQPAESVGGSKPIVEAAAVHAQSLGGPSLAARIYAPVAVSHFDQDDPRYIGKTTQVENIYLPSRIDPPPAPRSGIAQILNWLLKGKLQ